jgi:tetratricopeptide (TPR) repeat protein
MTVSTMTTIQEILGGSSRVSKLEEAITSRNAVALRPTQAGHPKRPPFLHNLAHIILTRFEHTGHTEDLEDSISLNRDVLALFPLGHPNHSLSFNNLAKAMTIGFQHTGQMQDLDEAITYNRGALSLRPPAHPNCSSSMRIHYNNQMGQMEDLEEAITHYREVLNLLPPDHLNRSI